MQSWRYGVTALILSSSIQTTKQGIIPEGLHFAYVQEEDKEALFSRTLSLLPYYNIDEVWLKNTFGVQITDAKSQIPLGGQLAVKQPKTNSQKLSAEHDFDFFD
ncbi:hypothetical protein HMPREF1869_00893 [Bacteroidales bacterium KA00251]|nr:hypothetical protein HMPREF1869_00893 [Bacteroidales bacterium KA00251]